MKDTIFIDKQVFLRFLVECLEDNERISKLKECDLRFRTYLLGSHATIETLINFLKEGRFDSELEL